MEKTKVLSAFAPGWWEWEWGRGRDREGRRRAKGATGWLSKAVKDEISQNVKDQRSFLNVSFKQY